MKPIPKPWRFRIAWGNPYTSPPDGQPRVLMSVTRLQIGGHPVPEEISRMKEQLGYGTGWCICISLDPDYMEQERQKRTLSPEQKANRRRQNLRRAAEKAVPLFSEQAIERTMSSNPEYYAGKEYRNLQPIGESDATE